MHEVDLFVFFIHGFVWVILVREYSAFAIKCSKILWAIAVSNFDLQCYTRVTKLLAQCH